jgi:tetratricopeptide (TPR) repeat protein
MSTKKPSSPADKRSQAAIEVFEKATRALGKRDYDKAKDLFETILSQFPDERDVLERARAYLVLCERALDKRPAFKPKTFDEVLHQGVYLHNKGDFEDAMKLLRQAAEMQPQNEHALYCLAATSARAGDSATALRALRQAVDLGPHNRTQARSDADFDDLREQEDFVAILYPQAS